MKDTKSRIRNLLRKFEDLSAIGIANISGTAISTLFWLYLATIISSEEYGEISYLIAIGSIGAVVAQIGGNATITVYAAKKIHISSTIMLISLATSVVSAMIILLITNNSIVSAYVIGYVIFGLSNAYLLGKEQFKKYAKFFVLQKIIFVALALSLNYVIGSHGVVLGVGLSFLIHIYTMIKIFRESKIDFPLLRTKMNFMFNSYGKDISRVIFSQIDKIIIAPFFGFALLGNYYLGLQFLSGLSIIPGIVLHYTLTLDSIGTSTLKLKKWIVGISIVMAILGVTVAPLVLPTLFPKFEHAGQIIQILSLAIVPRTVTMMYTSKFLGSERSQIVLIGSIISIAIQIPLIFILGTYFGVNGVASSLVISEFSLMMYYIIMKNKKNIS